jgi:peptide deformylase
MLEVRKYGDPVLRKKSDPVPFIGEKERKLIEDMIETMHKTDGVGIAAPQVGQNLRIIVINPTQEKGKDMVYINPEIIERKGSAKMTEGCLSVPGCSGEIKRSQEVVVKAQDIHGKEVTLRATGLLAVIFQHEIDHINGMLFVDRLGFLKKKMALRKLNKQKESHTL